MRLGLILDSSLRNILERQIKISAANNVSRNGGFMIGLGQQAFDKLLGKRYDAKPIAASLFYQEGVDLGIQGLPFEDFFISEEFEASYTLSKHPMQNGVKISDHVRKEPMKVPIKGMFTNHPISYKLNSLKNHDYWPPSSLNDNKSSFLFAHLLWLYLVR